MNSFLSSLVTLAQAAGEAAAPAAGAAPARQPSPFGSLWIFIPLIGIMYFLMIRPQQRKQKQVQEMLNQLKVGDKVMTNSGALGTIVKVTEKTVRVAFNSSVEIDFVRAAIAEVIKDQDEASDDKAGKK